MRVAYQFRIEIKESEFQRGEERRRFQRKPETID